MGELTCLLQAKRKKITISVIQRLMENIPRKVAAVIAAFGTLINYLTLSKHNFSYLSQVSFLVESVYF